MSHVNSDPLGVHRGVTGLRAEIREALLDAAHWHSCLGDGIDDWAEPFDGFVIDASNCTMTELLDRLVAIAERRSHD